MVLPANPCVPKRTTGGLSTVAIRCPKTEVTRKIIRLAGVPVAAPSANLSGKPSTTTAQHVLHDHNGRIDAIVDGGPCAVGVESTIVDLTESRPRLLRPGGVTPEELTAVLGDLAVDRAVTAPVSGDAIVKAPGMKYRHYAPQEPVIIVSGPGRRPRPIFAPTLPPATGCSALKRSFLSTPAAPPWLTAGRQSLPACRRGCLPPCGSWMTQPLAGSMPGALREAGLPTPCKTA